MGLEDGTIKDVIDLSVDEESIVLLFEYEIDGSVLVCGIGSFFAFHRMGLEIKIFDGKFIV
jgi:hypothetical protein